MHHPLIASKYAILENVNKIIKCQNIRKPLTFHGKIPVCPFDLVRIHYGAGVSVRKREVVVNVKGPIAHQSSRLVLSRQTYAIHCSRLRCYDCLTMNSHGR